MPSPGRFGVLVSRYAHKTILALDTRHRVGLPLPRSRGTGFFERN